ncbi:hypothetical protein CDAR_399481 [Caerostris darwini]|uniref:Uncharacterized protein n=1 Tax=Caerostris darwini TaxID=1538125 RepID=A0AAV4SW34_9ARAC|nr:hypothetical protein CDAR_399481 [Caerostris darwini]
MDALLQKQTRNSPPNTKSGRGFVGTFLIKATLRVVQIIGALLKGSCLLIGNWLRRGHSYRSSAGTRQVDKLALEGEGGRSFQNVKVKEPENDLQNTARRSS